MPKIPITTQTFNTTTGQAISTETIQAHLAPAPAGFCPRCATLHEADLPHNAQSLHYQYDFYAREGRWPDWTDAMAHCPPDIQALWTGELVALGVDVAAGDITPKRL